MQLDKRETFRLLIATTSSEDALQIDRTLKNEGMRTRTTLVADWDELQSALMLNSPPNDLLLVDLELEGSRFDEVLAEVRKLGRDLPYPRKRTSTRSGPTFSSMHPTGRRILAKFALSRLL